mmetsp:Transcript_6185/g.11025  ORF Transcript_6185/g.11025 Transcript_6185/m.11025 type:complete len:556 (-) Transcript_6185:223-1890(-)
MDLFIGVDVGTGSARAAVFDGNGVRLGMGLSELRIRSKLRNHFEQSSDQIWTSVASAVRQAVSESGNKSDIIPRIRGIGFDATCSLVFLDCDSNPVNIAVGEHENSEWNVIMWMDHRADQEAAFINNLALESEPVAHVVKHFGGAMYLENEPPKLLWLKNNMPSALLKSDKILDLGDFLTFKATGSGVRSSCTTACKWGRQESGWSIEFWSSVGLSKYILSEDADPFSKIGSIVVPPGVAIGNGLTEDAAKDLGLQVGTVVASCLIDAHSGGLGMIGASGLCEKTDLEELQSRVAVISGSSTCILQASMQPVFVPKVWGPFSDAMVSGLWLTEGGQSTTGLLLDHIIESHARSESMRNQSESSIHDALTTILLQEIESASSNALPHPLTHIHVLPYFHGNRHPRADPSLRGMITGLSLDDSESQLARIYGATVLALVYGARHLLEVMTEAGHNPKTLFVTGSGAQSTFYLNSLADATGCDVVLPQEPQSVLLGAAMLAASAFQQNGNHILEVMQTMSRVKHVIKPNADQTLFHNKKYSVFLKMYHDYMHYRHLMS